MLLFKYKSEYLTFLVFHLCSTHLHNTHHIWIQYQLKYSNIVQVHEQWFYGLLVATVYVKLRCELF